MRRLPKELTTVTKTSKTLALILFILLPFVGFFYGMKYQEALDQIDRLLLEEQLAVERGPTPTPQQETYREYESVDKHGYGYAFMYPSSWQHASTRLYSKGTSFVLSDITKDKVYQLPAIVQVGLLSDKTFQELLQEPTYQQGILSKENYPINDHTGTLFEQKYQTENTSNYDLTLFVNNVKFSQPVTAAETLTKNGVLIISLRLLSHDPEKISIVKSEFINLVSTLRILE